MRARCLGVTLVELVVTIVVVSAAVAAILGVLSAIGARSADQMLSSEATEIAESYLDEILEHPFGVDPCYPRCARSAMNSVGDYNGLVDVGVRDRTGLPVAALAGFTVRVAVINSPLGAVPASQSERVTVSVTTPAGSSVALTGFRTVYP